MAEDIKILKDLQTFLHYMATRVTIGEKTYYYLPYWFEDAGHDGLFHAYGYDRMPKKLTDYLEFKRDGVDSDPRVNPLLPEDVFTPPNLVAGIQSGHPGDIFPPKKHTGCPEDYGCREN